MLDTPPQTAARDHVDAGAGAVPEIAHARGGGDELAVVSDDVVALDIGEVLCGKESLRRGDTRGLLLASGQIAVGREVAQDPGRRQLNTESIGAPVVEGCEEHRRTELPFVELVGSLLVVAVEADLEAWKDLLGDTSVHVMGPLGPRCRVLGHLGSRRRIGELGEARIGHKLLARGREVACVAGMEGGSSRRLPDYIHAGAALPLTPKGGVGVEPEPDVEGDGGDDPPFVLEIDTACIAKLPHAVEDTDKLVGGLDTSDGEQYQGRGLPAGLLGGKERASTERVLRNDGVAPVGLQAGRKAAAVHTLGDAIEEKISEWVGAKAQAAVAGVGCHL